MREGVRAGGPFLVDDEWTLDAALVAEIDALLELKMRAGESATSPRRVGIHDFIERELAVAQAHSFANGPRRIRLRSMPACMTPCCTSMHGMRNGTRNP